VFSAGDRPWPSTSVRRRSPLKGRWQDEATTFNKRSLAGTDYVYCWVDGIHLKVRLEQDKVCLLVMIGVRADGTKELIALDDGHRESTESSLDLLSGCKRRGMAAPVLAVGDGALGFWSAVREVFPETREQWCWWHKVGNVLNALPKSAQPGAKKALAEIWNADLYEPCRQAIRAELPGARIVADRFRLVRGVNTALDAVRRERQGQVGRRRPKGVRRSGQLATWRPELYQARRLLAKGRERLSERERRRLCELFAADPVVGAARGLKEAFRSIYRAPDRAEAEARSDRFLAATEREVLPASAPSPSACGCGTRRCWPTSRSRPPTATRRG